MSEPQYCELHDWKQIGRVTTDNGMLSIVAPYFAGSLAEWWHKAFLPKLEKMRTGQLPRVHPQFEEVDLRQQTFKVGLDKPYEARETALVFDVSDNGGYDVDARFCDLWGDGRLSICELRIRLHGHYHDDELEETLAEETDEDDGEGDRLGEVAVHCQEAWIKQNFGDDAARNANYGWSTDGTDEPPVVVVSTKVYGHGILTTQVFDRGHGHEVTHEFLPFKDGAPPAA